MVYGDGLYTDLLVGWGVGGGGGGLEGCYTLTVLPQTGGKERGKKKIGRIKGKYRTNE